VDPTVQSLGLIYDQPSGRMLRGRAWPCSWRVSCRVSCLKAKRMSRHKSLPWSALEYSRRARALVRVRNNP